MSKLVNTVLLVDDDNMTNYLHQRVISKAEICADVKVAKNGQEGIEKLVELNQILTSKDDEVVVFLDLNMPILDGWGFLKEYEIQKEKLQFNIKIFVLSSSINPDDKARAEENKYVAQYVYKPLTSSSLQSLLFN
ncbi:MAG: response regulator [Flavobacterium psychrophilum]